jgi:hypothetical protein
MRRDHLPCRNIPDHPPRETIAAFSVLAVFSSLMFFTIVPVVQEPEISNNRSLFRDTVTSNNHKPLQMIEQINASTVLTAPANDKPVEIHQSVTVHKNKMSLNSIEYAAEKHVKHFETAPYC